MRKYSYCWFTNHSALRLCVLIRRVTSRRGEPTLHWRSTRSIEIAMQPVLLQHNRGRTAFPFEKLSITATIAPACQGPACPPHLKRCGSNCGSSNCSNPNCSGSNCGPESIPVRRQEDLIEALLRILLHSIHNRLYRIQTFLQLCVRIGAQVVAGLSAMFWTPAAACLSFEAPSASHWAESGNGIFPVEDLLPCRSELPYLYPLTAAKKSLLRGKVALRSSSCRPPNSLRSTSAIRICGWLKGGNSELRALTARAAPVLKSSPSCHLEVKEDPSLH